MTSIRSHTTNPNRVVRLPAAVVEIVLRPDHTIAVTFNDLGQYIADGSNRVSISAGAGATLKTFDFGTVDLISPPVDLSLEGLDADKPISFRLFIWEDGTKRITASNERLRARDHDIPADREPLLPVVPRKLGGEMWKLGLQDDEPPVLLVNSAIPHLKQRLLSSPELRAAIVPEATRQCLLHLCASVETDEVEPGSWQGKWFAFAHRYVPEKPEDWPSSTTDACREWADRVVQLYAADFNFSKAVASAWSVGDE